jgi:hypothetical protein
VTEAVVDGDGDVVEGGAMGNSMEGIEVELPVCDGCGLGRRRPEGQVAAAAS